MTINCLILGGGGFIGSALVDILLSQGSRVTVFERPNVKPHRNFGQDDLVRWIEGDTQNYADINAAMKGIDVVVHLVSTTLPKTSNDDPIHDVKTNLIATLSILEAMVANKVGRIVFLSSGGTVYGTPHSIPIKESHPTDPHVSYGITKLAIEKYILLYERMHGIQGSILRVSNPYGERQSVTRGQGAIAVFLHRAISNVPIEIWGDGSTTRDYVHVGDVASAVVRAMEYTGTSRVFNIGSGVGTSLNELVALVEITLQKTIEKKYFPARPFDIPVSILDNELARRELQWKPSIDLTDGLALTAQWLRRQEAR